MVTRYIGQCPVCEGDFRLHKMQMVHHGYTRPGHGSIQGDCPGVGWAPWELSPDGTIAYVDQELRPRLKNVQAWLARADRGAITELHVQEYAFGSRDVRYKLKTLTPADGYEFKRRLESETRNMRAMDERLVADINRRERRIADWSPQRVRTEEEDMARKAEASATSRAAREQARDARQAKVDATRAKAQAREDRYQAFLDRYRRELTALSRDPSRQKGDALKIWKKMFRDSKKEAPSMKRFLDQFVTELHIDEALIDLQLAEVRKDYLHYADDSGWIR